VTLPEPIRLLAAILDHAGPIPDEWRDQARACVREATEDPDAHVTIADVRRYCEALRAHGVEPPWYTMHKPGWRIEVEADEADEGGEDTASTIIAAQAKELEHLRAQRDLAQSLAPLMRWQLIGDGQFELADFCKLTKHRDGPWDVQFDHQRIVGCPLFAAIDLAESMMVKHNGHATSFDRTAFTVLIQDT